MQTSKTKVLTDYYKNEYIIDNIHPSSTTQKYQSNKREKLFLLSNLRRTRKRHFLVHSNPYNFVFSIRISHAPQFNTPPCPLFPPIDVPFTLSIIRYSELSPPTPPLPPYISVPAEEKIPFFDCRNRIFAIFAAHSRRIAPICWIKINRDDSWRE